MLISFTAVRGMTQIVHFIAARVSSCLLGACAIEDETTLHGYAEGEFVRVALVAKNFLSQQLLDESRAAVTRDEAHVAELNAH